MGGKTDLVNGRTKETAGVLTGNQKLRDEVGGDPGIGKAKDAATKAADEVNRPEKQTPDPPPTAFQRDVGTDSSRPSDTTVAVFGAGIAGLTAAHELTRLGYKVSVYEANSEPGGFFRSVRLPQNQYTPSEYSWHGFGPWYHNVFDLMKQIPFDEMGSMYDRAFSRSVDFGVFPDNGRAAFYDRGLLSIPKLFRMSNWDWAKWSWLMIKTWAANRRTQVAYSKRNAAEAWKPLLSERGYRTWRSTFGPWVGSDWTNVSLHQVGQFFRKQLITKPSHPHVADEDGPAWTHGAGNGWLLLRGPSNEVWFNKWVGYLEESGVRFFWNEPLVQLGFDGRTITSARLQFGAECKADLYVLATNPFAAAQIVDRTPGLENERELRLFKPLVQDGPHTQVSFRIAFSEPIRFPRARTAVVVTDSEFNLTLFAQEQVWRSDVNLGDGVKSLWTGTSCVGTVPGRVHKLPVIQCTKEQFIEEVKTQIFDCSSLDSLIKEANGGRGLADFEINRIEVWHEWRFSPSGIGTHQPKWVTTTHTQAYLPNQATSIPNLLLAGAHTRTDADVWSIEGAVESGRRAAQAIEPSVRVIPQYKPFWLRAISSIDDACFRVGLPHVIDLLLAVFVVVAAVTLGLLSYHLWSRSRHPVQHPTDATVRIETESVLHQRSLGWVNIRAGLRVCREDFSRRVLHVNPDKMVLNAEEIRKPYCVSFERAYTSSAERDEIYLILLFQLVCRMTT